MYINVFWSNVYKFPLPYKQLKTNSYELKVLANLKLCNVLYMVLIQNMETI